MKTSQVAALLLSTLLAASVCGCSGSPDKADEPPAATATADDDVFCLLVSDCSAHLYGADGRCHIRFNVNLYFAGSPAEREASVVAMAAPTRMPAVKALAGLVMPEVGLGWVYGDSGPRLFDESFVPAFNKKFPRHKILRAELWGIQD